MRVSQEGGGGSSLGVLCGKNMSGRANTACVQEGLCSEEETE